MSCTRSQEFLATATVTVREQIRADKQPIEGDAGLAMVRQAKRLVVAKGKKTVTIDLVKDRPSDDEVRALVLGPTGRLRAPAIRIGTTMIVGFTPDGLAAALGT
jgi:hypothetical protein